MILVLILCLMLGWMVHNFGKRVHGCTACGKKCDCDRSEGVCNHCLDKPDWEEETGMVTVDEMGNEWVNAGKADQECVNGWERSEVAAQMSKL